MKNIIVILIALCSIISVNNTFAQDKATKKDGRDAVEVTVDGLGCPFCAFGLEKKFKKVKGIKEIDIEMETGIMTFTVPASLELSREEVEERVTKAGYTAVDIVIERANGEVESTKETAKETTTATDEDAKVESATFSVSGNCGMCKARIEKAAIGIEGVISAIWKTETKELTLEYDENKVEIKAVQSKIAEVGHDTGDFRAATDVYESLPPCCLYDRVAETDTEDK